MDDGSAVARQALELRRHCLLEHAAEPREPGHQPWRQERCKQAAVLHLHAAHQQLGPTILQPEGRLVACLLVACLSLVPRVTLWLTRPGGRRPEQRGQGGKGAAREDERGAEVGGGLTERQRELAQREACVQPPAAVAGRPREGVDEELCELAVLLHEGRDLQQQPVPDTQARNLAVLHSVRGWVAST